MFVIEDELHAEQISTFSDHEAAMTELRRLASVPWDQAPNRAPCTSWAGCGRRYELIEYNADQDPWRELSRSPKLDVSANGVIWT
jgi:hypothetical protein